MALDLLKSKESDKYRTRRVKNNEKGNSITGTRECVLRRTDRFPIMRERERERGGSRDRHVVYYRPSGYFTKDHYNFVATYDECIIIIICCQWKGKA